MCAEKCSSSISKRANMGPGGVMCRAKFLHWPILFLQLLTGHLVQEWNKAAGGGGFTPCVFLHLASAFWHN